MQALLLFLCIDPFYSESDQNHLNTHHITNYDLPSRRTT